jgi:hypothetical protein
MPSALPIFNMPVPSLWRRRMRASSSALLGTTLPAPTGIDNKFKFGRLLDRRSAVFERPSPLQFQPAHEITFSEQRALVAENVVSRGRMEKEVRQRERHQEAFCCEQKRVFARFAPESKDYAARPTSPFRAKLGSFPAYTARPFYLSRGEMV